MRNVAIAVLAVSAALQAGPAAAVCRITGVTDVERGGALVTTICGPEQRQTVRRCDAIWAARRWNLFCAKPSAGAAPPGPAPLAGVAGHEWRWTQAGPDVLQACSSRHGPVFCKRLRITGDTTSLP